MAYEAVAAPGAAENDAGATEDVGAELGESAEGEMAG